MLNSHAPNCDWHTDHYPWECTCGFNKTKDTAAEWQSGYDAGIEAAAKALEDDAKTSGNFLWSEGQWHTYQIITSERAAKIVRAIKEQSK
jgi:hypothetical protein